MNIRTNYSEYIAAKPEKHRWQRGDRLWNEETSETGIIYDANGTSHVTIARGREAHSGRGYLESGYATEFMKVGWRKLTL